MSSGLNIQIDEVGEKRVIHIEGRLDATSTPQLEKKINELLELKNKFILVDFRKIDYLSSAGMRLLLSATKKIKSEGGKLFFCNMSDDVMEIIKMAGFERILTIYPTEKKALEEL